MAITLEGLKSKVASYQVKESSGGDKKWPSCTFLPDGKHKGRFITDPNSEIFLDYWSYGYFANGVRDPKSCKDLPSGFKDELKEIYESVLKPLNKWSYGPKNPHIAYFYLYETDSPNPENWVPDNLYVIVATKNFGEAYTSFLSSLAKDAPEDIMSSLNPEREGIILTIESKSGRDGKCSIGAGYPVKKAPPINMEGRAYLPLDDCYIKPGFSQERYDKLVAKYKEAAMKFGLERELFEKTKQSEVPNDSEVETSIPFKESAPAKENVIETTTSTEKVEDTKPQPTSSNDAWSKFRPKV